MFESRWWKEAMLRADNGNLYLGAGAAGLLFAALLTAGPVHATPGAVVLAPHRAIYDLKLARSPGKRQLEAVRGRILYDFSGNVCDGYALQFRQVSELDSGEGKVALSDLRAVTWEDGAAKSFRFNSENFLNQKSLDAVDGRAERKDDGVAVKLAKPASKSFSLESGMVFPAEHMRRIIEAALEGKTILEFPVYDGSETGEKVFNTLTIIGKEIAPGEKPVDDAAAKSDAMAKLRRWPVRISYFDRAVNDKAGEQTPVYAIGFELYENGISRALSLDYGDFVISGEMSQLDLRDSKPCR
jgi:hypothetical protein